MGDKAPKIPGPAVSTSKPGLSNNLEETRAMNPAEGSNLALTTNPPLPIKDLNKPKIFSAATVKT
ncbi:hypothetical protein [Vulcanisaeta distributa]|uniref:hypothetical protein n=1 Tax=Vulcanisaeta distributa TaxID=164451 RepID=UPI001FB2DA32|nr:hypothetical protein [Vulcanisaeta distributa]